jgi:periplasmic copper chaperone A
VIASGPHARSHERSRRRPVRGARLLGLLLTTITLAGCSDDGVRPLTDGTPELLVSSAQASAPIAGASQLVLTIENRGDGDDRLLGVATDAALAIEIHRTEVDADGRASMRMLDAILLPAGEQVAFRPGGLHLMVVVPDGRVTVGGTFDVLLRFERSAPITLTATVVDLLDLVERTEDDA